MTLHSFLNSALPVLFALRGTEFPLSSFRLWLTTGNVPRFKTANSLVVHLFDCESLSLDRRIRIDLAHQFVLHMVNAMPVNAIPQLYRETELSAHSNSITPPEVVIQLQLLTLCLRFPTRLNLSMWITRLVTPPRGVESPEWVTQFLMRFALDFLARTELSMTGSWTSNSFSQFCTVVMNRYIGSVLPLAIARRNEGDVLRQRANDFLERLQVRDESRRWMLFGNHWGTIASAMTKHDTELSQVS